ncbi:MAG: M20/M25/M40 family metallo-hydrolase [Candidatus Moranbacteria bacterium]|nr:M20/M25/M40 family metallo-hydrolase [Candidatus Moranbacteria bacterium]
MPNTDSLINLFFDLVKISSQTGKEEKLSRFCFDFLNQQKIKAQKYYNNNIFVPAKAWNPIMLNAHLDTVGPAENIEPAEKNGRLFSKGKSILGADNKATLAVILWLLKNLKQQKSKVLDKLEITFTVAEESDNIGAKELNYKKIKSRFVILADSIMPLGAIVKAAPYYYRIEGKICGKPAHACRPQKGINVLPAFAQFIQKADPGRNKGRTLNIGLIEGGSAVNTVPGFLSFKGELRGFNEKFVKKEVSKLKNLAENLKQVFGLKKFEINFILENKGYKIKEQNEIVEDIKKCIKLNQIEPQIVKNWACSDANIFAQKGLTPINIGDGVFNAHTQDEYIEVKDLEKLYEIFKSFVLKIDQKKMT